MYGVGMLGSVSLSSRILVYEFILRTHMTLSVAFLLNILFLQLFMVFEITSSSLAYYHLIVNL